ERPIQLGDAVELGTLMGHVRRIGLRSVSVETLQGAEVIVPNQLLINAQLINWTRSRADRRVDLPVSVAPGPEPDQVIAILRQAAAGHPDVHAHPAPLVVVNKIGKTSLDFELQFWVPQETLVEARTAVVMRVSEALKAAEIAMA